MTASCVRPKRVAFASEWGSHPAITVPAGILQAAHLNSMSVMCRKQELKNKS